MHIGKNSIYEQLSSDEMERLRKYLDSRFAKRRSANKIGVVFDILHSCILRCVGCGTNACYQATETPVACAPSLKEIELVFQKLRKALCNLHIVRCSFDRYSFSLDRAGPLSVPRPAFPNLVYKIGPDITSSTSPKERDCAIILKTPPHFGGN